MHLEVTAIATIIKNTAHYETLVLSCFIMAISDEKQLCEVEKHLEIIMNIKVCQAAQNVLAVYHIDLEV